MVVVTIVGVVVVVLVVVVVVVVRLGAASTLAAYPRNLGRVIAITADAADGHQLALVDQAGAVGLDVRVQRRSSGLAVIVALRSHAIRGSCEIDVIYIKMCSLIRQT